MDARRQAVLQQRFTQLYSDLLIRYCDKHDERFIIRPHCGTVIERKLVIRLIIFGIVIGFPLLEGVVLYKLASGPEGHGGWVLAWLVFAAIAGVVLIKEARFSLVSRLAEAFSQGRFSLAAFIDSFRTVLAGLLLIFPGLISDALALCLLLLPIREPAYCAAGATTRRSRDSLHMHSAIEGEFRRET